MGVWVALVRDISAAIARCELTHVARQPIDLVRARHQHQEYCQALARLGCRVERLATDDSMPDSVFIEDTALVVDEVALVTRPGASSRRGETAAVRAALSTYRRVVEMAAPATADGGDIIVAGRRVFVGRSGRTNQAGIDVLTMTLAPYGYLVEAVEVGRCLHLKSAATALDDLTLLINPAWVQPEVFHGLATIAIDPRETAAANVVRVGDTCLAADGAPRTRERLEAAGYRVATVAADELAKAEGAVTCCSLILRAP